MKPLQTLKLRLKIGVLVLLISMASNAANTNNGLNNAYSFLKSSPLAIVKLDNRLYTAANILADANTVVFDNAYSNAVDGDDAIKLAVGGENFGIQKPGAILVVEGRQPLTTNDTIYFNTTGLQQQTYTLQFDAINMDYQHFTATLQDKYLLTNTTIDLSTTTNVPFTVDANAASSATDRFKIVFILNTPLPVNFISIAANVMARGNQIQFTVSNQTSLLQYIIQKSTDGIHFVTATTLAPSATTEGIKTYTWVDATIYTSTVYYRVKSISINGAEQTSTIIKLAVKKAAYNIAIAPNPIEGNSIHLQLNNTSKGKYSISVKNMEGKAMFNTTYNGVASGLNALIYLPANYNKGLYWVEVLDANGVKQILKIVKL
jgi:hypothetical protein